MIEAIFGLALWGWRINSSKHPLIDVHTIVHDIGMHPINIMY